jgi:hypothetical protein
MVTMAMVAEGMLPLLEAVAPPLRHSVLDRPRALAGAHRFARCQCEVSAAIERFIPASDYYQSHRGSNRRRNFVRNDSNRMSAPRSRVETCIELIAFQVSRAVEINRSRMGAAKSTASSEIAETNLGTASREITMRFATERMVNSQTETRGFALTGETTFSRSVPQLGSATGIGVATIGGMVIAAISLTVRG